MEEETPGTPIVPVSARYCQQQHVCASKPMADNNPLPTNDLSKAPLFIQKCFHRVKPCLAAGA